MKQRHKVTHEKAGAHYVRNIYTKGNHLKLSTALISLALVGCGAAGSDGKDGASGKDGFDGTTGNIIPLQMLQELK